MADDIDCGPAGTSHTCDLSYLGELPTDTPIPVYFACVDSVGNNHTSATNTEAEFTIDATAPIQSRGLGQDISESLSNY